MMLHSRPQNIISHCYAYLIREITIQRGDSLFRQYFVPIFSFRNLLLPD